MIPPSPFLADERVFPFLGPLKVAAELQKNGNHVEVLDLSGFENYEEIVREYCRSTNVVHFGITATTPQLPNAVLVSKAIKELIPYASTILGGPHATMTHTAYRMDEAAGTERRGTKAWRELEDLFDVIVVGDGEKAIFWALDCDRSYKDNRAEILDAGNIKSPLFMKRGELDDYAWPARDLIDLGSYRYEIDGRPAFSTIAQLGCPFKCGFCGGRDSHVFRVTRTRSAVGVVDEIRMVVEAHLHSERPLTGVMFYDDELNVSPGGLEELCRELIALQVDLGIDMRFRGFIKAELFTRDQARLMHEAGFRVLLSGVESGSDFILEVMQKNTTAAINERCLDFAREAGMQFKALMSIGHPGETRATVAESVDWVFRVRPDDVDWTVITQYPGSPYYDHSEAEGDHWLYTEPRTGAKLYSADPQFTEEAWFYKGVPGDYTSYVWTDDLSAEDLVELRDSAEKVTRMRLGLPDVRTVAARQFEHSMGQGLPASVLRSS